MEIGTPVQLYPNIKSAVAVPANTSLRVLIL
jgi:hypothetical protein